MQTTAQCRASTGKSEAANMITFTCIFLLFLYKKLYKMLMKQLKTCKLLLSVMNSLDSYRLPLQDKLEIGKKKYSCCL